MIEQQEKKGYEPYEYDAELASRVRVHYKKAPLKITAKKFNLDEDYTYYLVKEYKRRERVGN